MLDPWICQSFCLQSWDWLTLKAVKVSVNASNVSYKSCTLHWYAKKEIYIKYLFAFTNFFLPGLPNLSTQIKCSQNWYTPLSNGPKIPRLFAFFYSKPFQNNQTHCEIIDHYFNIYFVKIQLKKENLKSVFLVQEFGYSIGILVSPTTWICHCSFILYIFGAV